MCSLVTFVILIDKKTGSEALNFKFREQTYTLDHPFSCSAACGWRLGRCFQSTGRLTVKKRHLKGDMKTRARGNKQKIGSKRWCFMLQSWKARECVWMRSKSYLESHGIQHFPLLPLTWTDVPLCKIIVRGEYPLYLPGGDGRGRPQTPRRCARGCRAAPDPALKFPNHAALVAQLPALCAGIHRLGQEDSPGLGAALHL